MPQSLPSLVPQQIPQVQMCPHATCVSIGAGSALMNDLGASHSEGEGCLLFMAELPRTRPPLPLGPPSTHMGALALHRSSAAARVFAHGRSEGICN